MTRGFNYDTPAWRAVRREVLERDGYTCQIKLPGCRKVATQVDHVTPVIEGGALLDKRNLRAACSRCNTGRANMARAEAYRIASRVASTPESCRGYPHDGCRGVDEICPRCGRRGPSRVW